MKKSLLITLILCLVLSLGLFGLTACSGGNKGGDGGGDEGGGEQQPYNENEEKL